MDSSGDFPKTNRRTQHGMLGTEVSLLVHRTVFWKSLLQSALLPFFFIFTYTAFQRNFADGEGFVSGEPIGASERTRDNLSEFNHPVQRFAPFVLICSAGSLLYPLPSYFETEYLREHCKKYLQRTNTPIKLARA